MANKEILAGQNQEISVYPAQPWDAAVPSCLNYRSVALFVRFDSGSVNLKVSLFASYPDESSTADVFLESRYPTEDNRTVLFEIPTATCINYRLVYSTEEAAWQNAHVTSYVIGLL